MRLLRRPARTVLLAAISVHAGVVCASLWRSGRVDTYAFNSLDAGEYWNLGRNLAHHGTFSTGGIPQEQADEDGLEPDTWRTPGYPLFLAVVIVIFGDSPSAAIIVQQILCVLNVWLFFRLGQGYLSRQGAAIAAILFLVEPYRLFYSLWLLATTLFITVLLLTWVAWRRVLETRRWSWVVALGALCGFAVLVRPVAGLVPIALLAGLCIRALRGERDLLGQRRTRVPWAAVPVFAAVCLAVIGSWMYRNHVVAGHVALSDQGGVVLAYFKATEVELWRDGRTEDRYTETSLNVARRDDPHPVWDSIDVELREELAHLPDEVRATLSWRNLAQGNRTPADSFEVSAALRRIGWSRLMSSPIDTATCCLARCGSLLTFPLNLIVKPPKGVAAATMAWLIACIPYVALSGWIVIQILRNGRGLLTAVFPILCTLALLIATTPQLDPRFRVPMIPFLLYLAFLPRALPHQQAAPVLVAPPESPSDEPPHVEPEPGAAGPST